MAVSTQPQFAGLVANPVLSVRLNNAQSAVDMSVSALLDAAFGSSQGQTLYRGAVGWNSSAATGPFALVFKKSGAIGVANDITLWEIVPSTMVCTFVRCTCKTAPVGASLLLGLSISTDSGVSFTDSGIAFGIGDGNNEAAHAFAVTLATSSIVRLDCTQVGSGTAGSDLTVSLFGDAAQ